jgi:hypothetical protein
MEKVERRNPRTVPLKRRLPVPRIRCSSDAPIPLERQITATTLLMRGSSAAQPLGPLGRPFTWNPWVPTPDARTDHWEGHSVGIPGSPRRPTPGQHLRGHGSGLPDYSPRPVISKPHDDRPAGDAWEHASHPSAQGVSQRTTLTGGASSPVVKFLAAGTAEFLRIDGRWLAFPPERTGARRPVVAVPRDVTAGAYAPPDTDMHGQGRGFHDRAPLPVADPGVKENFEVATGKRVPRGGTGVTACPDRARRGKPHQPYT